MIRIEVRERGTSRLTPQEWDLCRTSPEFDRLLKAGILKATYGTGGCASLSASCFVGRSVLHEGVVLDVVEKIPGALRSLLSHARRKSFRIAPIAGYASDLSDLTILLVREFVEAVETYVSGGRQFEYAALRQAAPVIAGRLLVPQTVRLRARGLGHLAAFERVRLHHVTSLNRTILVALGKIEHIDSILGLPPALLARARALAMLFSDCRDGLVLFGSRERLLALVEKAEVEASQFGGSEEERDLIALARVLVAERGFRFDDEQTEVLPRSWFLNLENLFERAVRSILNQSWSGGRVLNGKHDPPPIFPDRRGDGPSANPDLVFDSERMTHLIGDVKYKDWAGSIAASDLYQLLVHAAAFETALAFTVQPANKYATVDLGVSTTGCRTLLFAVDVCDLKADLKRLLSVLTSLRDTTSDLDNDDGGDSDQAREVEADGSGSQQEYSA